MNLGTDEERFERVLRWMTTNLEVASSVYHTPEGVLKVKPALTIAPNGNTTRSNALQPADRGDWELTSASALIACCYIDALWQRWLPRTDPFDRTQISSVSEPSWSPTWVTLHKSVSRKGADHTVEVLYGAIVVVSFTSSRSEMRTGVGRGGDTPYWFIRSNQPALNVDRLVRGCGRRDPGLSCEISP